MTEKELQDYKLPKINTDKELVDFINKMISVGNSYNTAPYSIALSAYAVFMYVAEKLEVTGFQASCADIQFLKRTRDLEDGFSIVDYSKLLYPQYKDSFEKYSFDNLLRENLPHLKERAKKLLEEKGDYTHENVIKHWKMIVDMKE